MTARAAEQQAVEEYTTTLVIEPAFTDALFNLAVDTTSTDPAGAGELYLRVVALQPGFAAAWLNLGLHPAVPGRCRGGPVGLGEGGRARRVAGVSRPRSLAIPDCVDTETIAR